MKKEKNKLTPFQAASARSWAAHIVLAAMPPKEAPIDIDVLINNSHKVARFLMGIPPCDIVPLNKKNLRK